MQIIFPFFGRFSSPFKNTFQFWALRQSVNQKTKSTLEVIVDRYFTFSTVHIGALQSVWWQVSKVTSLRAIAAAMAAMAATTAAAAAWEASSAAHRTSYILNRRPPPPLVTALLAESWQSQRQSQSERVAESVVAGTSRVLQTPSFSSSSSTSLPQHRQTETTTQPQTDRHRKVASASASASSGFLCLETPLTSSQVLSLQATLNFLSLFKNLCRATRGFCLLTLDIHCELVTSATSFYNRHPFFYFAKFCLCVQILNQKLQLLLISVNLWK